MANEDEVKKNSNPLLNRHLRRIPKVVHELHLADYHPDLEEGVMHVWVNITQEMHREYGDIQSVIRQNVAKINDIVTAFRKSQTAQGLDPNVAVEGEHKAEIDKLSGLIKDTNRRLWNWLSVIWSQGPDGTHLDPDQVQELATRLADEDEALWRFIMEGSYSLIIAHRNRISKN